MPTKNLLSNVFNCSVTTLNRDIHALNRMMYNIYSRFDHAPHDKLPKFNDMFAAIMLCMNSIFQNFTFIECAIISCIHYIWDDEDVGVNWMVRELNKPLDVMALVKAATDPRIIRMNL